MTRCAFRFIFRFNVLVLHDSDFHHMLPSVRDRISRPFRTRCRSVCTRMQTCRVCRLPGGANWNGRGGGAVLPHASGALFHTYEKWRVFMHYLCVLNAYHIRVLKYHWTIHILSDIPSFSTTHAGCARREFRRFRLPDAFSQEIRLLGRRH